MRNSRRATLVALVVVVAAGIVASATFLTASRLGGGESNRELNRLLKQRSARLNTLQDQANEARGAVSKAFDLLDQVLNAIREPAGAGIGKGRDLWTQAPALMQQARKANQDLPRLTADIVDEASKARQEIRKYFGSQKGEAQIRYVEALDVALASLVDTNVHYSEMNQRLAEGFPEYETLFSRTDKFFKEFGAKAFRSPAEASQVYTLANSSLVGILAALRLDLDRLEKVAADSGRKTTQAFSAAARLRPPT